MEVHAHTHSPRKKWTHYLWEFLMLFLAVTAGFFMENQREHYVERQREKVYIKGLLNDLIADTTTFSRYVTNGSENYLRIDSLMKFLKVYKPGDSTAELYYLARTLWGKIDRLQYNSRTYDQLKSSGSLRLIHSESVLDSISRYFESLQWIDLQNLIQIERQTLYGLGIGEVFDAWTIDSIFNTNFEKPASAPPLLTSEKVNLNRFVIRLHALKGVYNYIIKRVINDYLPNAKKLIVLIKEEYHLK
jgi:hypothetical protein